MKEESTFFYDGKALFAKLCCEIDHHTCRILREKIDQTLFERKPEILVIDFSEVRFMDSSGLGLILGRVQKVSAIGARVEVRGMSDSLYKLVRLSGIERVKNLSVKNSEQKIR